MPNYNFTCPKWDEIFRAALLSHRVLLLKLFRQTEEKYNSFVGLTPTPHLTKILRAYWRKKGHWVSIFL